MARVPKTKPAELDVQPAQPSRVRLLRPYGYIDDEGRHHHWRAGYSTESANEILVLIERGASLDFLE